MQWNQDQWYLCREDSAKTNDVSVNFQTSSTDLAPIVDSIDESFDPIYS